MRPAAVLFAKAPVPGRVKTRLQPQLTPQLSASLHEAFVGDMWDKLAAHEDALEPLLYSNSTSPGFTHLGDDIPVELQRGNDLGAKMFHCFAEQRAADRPVTLILGTDSPTLPSSVIHEALEALKSFDAVLTPVDDGGYCLIGVREPHPAMFEGVHWSSGHELGQTIAALERCGLRAHRTSGWYDVDTAADLVRLATDPGVLLRTRAWLDQHEALVSGLMNIDP